jgi:hypothetical protein
MRMRQEILDKLINKMIKHIKPNGVSELIYTLEPTDDTGDEYYMMVKYVVPDDSEYLRSSNMRNSDFNRKLWNTEIAKTIKNYFGINVIINNSGTRSESEYKRRKNYE